MASRFFTDPAGQSWQAWDVVPAQQPDWPSSARRHLPDVMSSGWLAFESATEKRRLHPIPPDWELGTDQDLWRHCLRAIPAAPRAPRARAQETTRPLTVDAEG